jgi:hypothetical protein
MINQSKYVKPAIVIALVVSIVSLISYAIVKDEESYRYRITDQKNCYRTNEYTEYDDGCITFVSNKRQQQIMICGPYTIIDNPHYSPK